MSADAKNTTDFVVADGLMINTTLFDSLYTWLRMKHRVYDDDLELQGKKLTVLMQTSFYFCDEIACAIDCISPFILQS